MIEATLASWIDSLVDSPFATAVVSNAIIAAAIALVAWIGSRVYRNPMVWHAVWVLAMLKLLLPPIHCFSVDAQRFHSETTANEVDADDTDAPANSDRTVSDAAQPLSPPTLATTRSDVGESVSSQSSGVWGVNRVQFSLRLAVIGLWALGSIMVLCRSTYRIVRFHRLVRDSMHAGTRTQSLLESVAAQLSQLGTGLPPVRFVDRTIPPLLWPVGWRAKIILPACWWETLGTSEQRAVLSHELIHWRRRDHWVRMLQLVTGVVFWWHPLIWIARRELHRLEEECCDAEILHRFPTSGRLYASTLLSVSQWLKASTGSDWSERRTEQFAVTISDLTYFKDLYRRIEMLPQLRYQPWTWKQVMVLIVFLVLPLVLGLDVQSQQSNGEQALEKSALGETSSARVVGQVADTEGNPIANAKVRVVIPTADLRQPNLSGEHREFLTTTDAQGKYDLEIDGISGKVAGSVDILHPNHRRLVGTMMSGGDENSIDVTPKQKTEFNAKLPKSLYFAGQVVDESGNPIENVLVHSSLVSNSSSAGVERSRTDAQGRFEIFGYEPRFFADDFLPTRGKQTAFVTFEHDMYTDHVLRGLEEMEPSERDSIRVAMDSGYSIAGVVKDADGSPASGVVLSITNAENHERKAVRTGDDGRFQLAGLPSGRSTVRVVDVRNNRKRMNEIQLDQDMTSLMIELNSFESPIKKTFQVLGMTLTNVTPEINEAYELERNETWGMGVMIVDPGNDFERFEIGEVRAGDVFWMVGNEQVNDLGEFVTQLGGEARSPSSPPESGGNTSAIVFPDGSARVRVVYSTDRETGRYSNTQYMRLEPKDIAALNSLPSTDR